MHGTFPPVLAELQNEDGLGATALILTPGTGVMEGTS